MMMNDLREGPMPPAEMGSTPKIVAALVVALGFGAMGAYSYETGTWNTPQQVVASKDVPPPAPLDNATPSDAVLQSAADLPPAAPPAPVKDVPAAPVKDVPAQASVKAAAPAIKVARAQAPAPSLSQAPAAQASPEPAAPVASIPEPPAAQTTPAPVDTPPQEAPAPAAPAEATPPAGP